MIIENLKGINNEGNENSENKKSKDAFGRKVLTPLTS